MLKGAQEEKNFTKTNLTHAQGLIELWRAEGESYIMNPEEQGQGQQVELTPEVIVGAIEANPELAQAIQPHVLTKDAVSSFLNRRRSWRSSTYD